MTDPREGIDPRVWRIVGVTLLAPLMTSIDTTVVNVSLSALSRELHASLATIQWVTSGYLLALALTLPLSSWLVSRYGAKNLYLLSFAMFTATSLLCGTASSAMGLISFRVLQGASAGLLTPMGQLLTVRIAGRHVARVMGVAVMPAMLGPILGPALAGLILQHGSWRWIFLINLPIGIWAIVMAWRILPRDTPEANPRGFDLAGFLLLSPALVMFLHSLGQLSAQTTGAAWNVLELAASVALLLAFWRHAGRLGNDALVDPRLFDGKTFSASASTQFLAICAMYGGQMLMPLYLLMVLGKSPASAGLLLAPTGVGMLCTYPLTGPLTERFGPRSVSTAGALIALLGTAPFALAGLVRLPDAAICAVLFIRGIGLGCINIPCIAAAYSSVRKEVLPIATTTLNIVQRLGGPVGVTLLAIALHLNLRPEVRDSAHGFARTFGVLCTLHALTVFAARRLPRRTPHRSESTRANMPVGVETLAE
jgi:EmrB/QacA subfamily drug resistance transporter